MNGLQFQVPLALLALPLALLPLLRGMRQLARRTPSLMLLPRDVPSMLLDAALRAAAALAIGATVLALAGPYLAGREVARVGRGAEIVLVIDRSSSMDEGLLGQGAQGRIRNMRPAPGEETKASVARDVLARFVAARKHDSFSLVLFSLYPIAVLPFTQKTEAVQAAIEASRVGRGLGNTDIGLALQTAAAQFDQRAYAGSRVVVLVSDGGADLEPEVKAALAKVLQLHRISLYWIYLRGSFGTQLEAAGTPSLPGGDTLAKAPAQALHEYFGKLGIAYRAYEAVQASSVQAALDDLARQERHALHYTERLPRHDLVPAALGTALAALGLLLLSRAWVVRGVRGARQDAGPTR